MPFKAGQSGNPGGRPKAVAHIRELAREHTEAAIKTLVAEMTGESPAARVAASNSLLDRGWGKPLQTVDMNVTRVLAEITDAELAAIASSGGLTAPAKTNGAGPSGRVH